MICSWKNSVINEIWSIVITIAASIRSNLTDGALHWILLINELNHVQVMRFVCMRSHIYSL
jgi:hypothetical protein